MAVKPESEADFTPGAPPPRPFLGLRRHATEAPLDVSIGAWHLIGLPAVPLLLLTTAAAALAPLVPEIGTTLVVFFSMAWVVLLAVNVHLCYERVKVADGTLRWCGQRCGPSLIDTARPLAEVVSVRDTGKLVRVSFVDGDLWLIGDRLGVPDSVRRWLTWQLNDALARRNAPPA